MWVTSRLAISSFLMIAGCVLLYVTPSPWMDELMLLANLRDISFVNLVEPLPYYEQTAPVGQAAFALLIKQLFGFEAVPTALRLYTLSAFFGMIGILIAGFRSAERPTYPFLLVVLMISAPLLVSQMTQTKHYMGDAFFGALILVVGLQTARRPDLTRMLLYFAASVAAALFSLVSIVPTMATLGAILLAILEKREAATHPEIRYKALRSGLSVAGMGLILAGLFLTYKILYIDRVSYFQFTAYPEAYQNFIGHKGGEAENFIHAVKLAHYLISNFVYDKLYPGPSVLYLVAIFGVPLAVIVLGRRAGKETRFLANAACICTVTIIVLNVTKFFPIAYDRHLSFVQPFYLTLIAMLVATYFGREKMPVWLLAGLSILAVDGVISSVSQPRGHLWKTMALLESPEVNAPDTPIWVSFSAQPAFDVAGWDGARLLGQFDRTSGETSWTVRGGGRNTNGQVLESYHSDMVQTIDDLDKVRLVFSKHWKINTTPFLIAAAASGWSCDLELKRHDVEWYLCSRMKKQNG